MKIYKSQLKRLIGQVIFEESSVDKLRILHAEITKNFKKIHDSVKDITREHMKNIDNISKRSAMRQYDEYSISVYAAEDALIRFIHIIEKQIK